MNFLSASMSVTRNHVSSSREADATYMPDGKGASPSAPGASGPLSRAAADVPGVTASVLITGPSMSFAAQDTRQAARQSASAGGACLSPLYPEPSDLIIKRSAFRNPLIFFME